MGEGAADPVELPFMMADVPFQEIEPLAHGEPSRNWMTESRLAECLRIEPFHNRDNARTSFSPSRSQCVQRVGTGWSKRFGRDSHTRAEPEQHLDGTKDEA